jgi:hypothetical protein
MRIVIPCVVAMIMGVAGCQAKLSVSKTIKVPDGADVAHVVQMSAQPAAQKVSVSVKVVSGSPVDIYILRASDVGDAVAGDKKEKQTWEGKAFGSKQAVTNVTLKADVPANTAFKVVVVPADLGKEPATVELKITN